MENGVPIDREIGRKRGTRDAGQRALMTALLRSACILKIVRPLALFGLARQSRTSQLLSQ
jgi:hypothetical protein